ncbi:DUF4350 domain-containing protein [Brevundimonas lenta]|uniref:DUF4350 domain-containing protein n=1 Tax=Brevundimonas lenta TaxID=424796 RepID=A0A7W6JEM8_9CAUL|nr:DUF4350 domain-containing protein [Brevundimonas lenta]MBB4083740.1 hypothetical protein [Brevundimonas lenta]
MSRAKGGEGGFSALTIAVILIVGVVALAGIGVLSAYAPELKSGNDGKAHPLSRASVGFGALPRLLGDLGVPVVMSRGPLTEASEGGLLVLTPTMETNPEQIEDFDHLGPTLIVLPKWSAAPHPKQSGWVSTGGTLPAEAALQPLPDGLGEATGLAERQERSTVRLRRPNGAPFGAPVQVDSLRTLQGGGWIPVVLDERGGIVLGMDPTSHVYVLADPDLINTQGLKTLAGARTAVELLAIVRADGMPVIFDLTLHGFQRTRSLLRLMLEPPLLGMTLALVALALLGGYQAAVRFGPARVTGPVFAAGKRGLADNTAALVRIARREPHMAAPYALIVRAIVARAIGAPRGLSDEALDEFLDRVSRISGTQDTYSALAAEARDVKTPGDLLRVAGALHRWNQELTRARQ